MRNNPLAMPQQFYTTIQLSARRAKTPEGFLVVEGVPVARVGEQIYLPGEVPNVNAGGARQIIVERNEADVFDPEAIRSFEGKPLTVLHPTEFVNAKNWKSHSVGAMQNVRRGEGEFAGKLVSDIIVYEQSAIEKVERNELRELSCGYEAEYIEVAPGRARQTSIRGNHLALVPRGRAGPECAIFDSAPEVKTMSWKDQIKQALTGLSKAVDSAPDDGEEETMDAVKARAADLQKKLDEANAKLAAFEKSKDEGEAKMAEAEKAKDAAIKARDAAIAELAASKAAPAKTTHDAATVAAAEVIAPGIAKDLPDLKVAALKQAATTDEGKAALKAVFGDAAPDYSTPAVVDVAFRAVAAQVADARNRKTVTPPAKTEDANLVRDFASAFNDAAAKLHALPKF